MSGLTPWLDLRAAQQRFAYGTFGSGQQAPLTPLAFALRLTVMWSAWVTTYASTVEARYAAKTIARKREIFHQLTASALESTTTHARWKSVLTGPAAIDFWAGLAEAAEACDLMAESKTDREIEIEAGAYAWDEIKKIPADVLGGVASAVGGAAGAGVWAFLAPLLPVIVAGGVLYLLLTRPAGKGR